MSRQVKFIIATIILIAAIYLNVWKLKQYEGQGEQRRDYQRMKGK